MSENKRFKFLRFCDDPELACCRAEKELERLTIENDKLNHQLTEFADLAKAKAVGRLAILPCKLGTQVYCLVTNRCMLEHNRCFACKSVLYSDECRKTAHIESLFFEYNMISFIGETVFLTKEKAEAALKQIGVQNE